MSVVTMKVGESTSTVTQIPSLLPIMTSPAIEPLTLFNSQKGTGIASDVLVVVPLVLALAELLLVLEELELLVVPFYPPLEKK